jgi:hypothetical protein
VISVGEPVRPRSGRGNHGLLAEPKRGVLRAEVGEQLRDRPHPLRVDDRVAVSLVDAEREAVDLRELGEEAGSVDVRCPKLEVRVAWPAHGSRHEERASQVRGATADTDDDAPRRAVERGQVGVEDAGLVERLERAGVLLEVNLVPRRLLERAGPVRADLARHAVGAKEREGPPRDRAARHLEVKGDPAAAAQVHRPRRPHKSRELGQPAAPLPRLDRRQLAADVVGEAQSSTPSRASRRFL